METRKFQENLVEDIQSSLGKKEIPLERIRGLANAALDLDDKYPEGIPKDEALELLKEYGEITGASAEKYARQIGEADEKGIEEARRALGLDERE